MEVAAGGRCLLVAQRAGCESGSPPSKKGRKNIRQGKMGPPENSKIQPAQRVAGLGIEGQVWKGLAGTHDVTSPSASTCAAQKHE